MEQGHSACNNHSSSPERGLHPASSWGQALEQIHCDVQPVIAALSSLTLLAGAWSFVAYDTSSLQDPACQRVVSYVAIISVALCAFGLQLLMHLLSLLLGKLTWAIATDSTAPETLMAGKLVTYARSLRQAVQLSQHAHLGGPLLIVCACMGFHALHSPTSLHCFDAHPAIFITAALYGWSAQLLVAGAGLLALVELVWGGTLLPISFTTWTTRMSCGCATGCLALVLLPTDNDDSNDSSKASLARAVRSCLWAILHLSILVVALVSLTEVAAAALQGSAQACSHVMGYTAVISVTQGLYLLVAWSPRIQSRLTPNIHLPQCLLLLLATSSTWAWLLLEDTACLAQHPDLHHALLTHLLLGAGCAGLLSALVLALFALWLLESLQQSLLACLNLARGLTALCLALVFSSSSHDNDDQPPIHTPVAEELGLPFFSLLRTASSQGRHAEASLVASPWAGSPAATAVRLTPLKWMDEEEARVQEHPAAYPTVRGAPIETLLDVAPFFEVDLGDDDAPNTEPLGFAEYLNILAVV